MCMQQYGDLCAWGYPEDKLKCLLNNVALIYFILKKSDANDINYSFYWKTLLYCKTYSKWFYMETQSAVCAAEILPVVV